MLGPKAGTVTIREEQRGNVRALALFWIADSAGALRCELPIARGTLISFTGWTNATAAATYNVRIYDSTLADVLQAQGLSLSETAAERAALAALAGSRNRPIIVGGPLWLDISASAGRQGKLTLNYRPDFALRREAAGVA